MNSCISHKFCIGVSDEDFKRNSPSVNGLANFQFLDVKVSFLYWSWDWEHPL